MAMYLYHVWVRSLLRRAGVGFQARESVYELYGIPVCIYTASTERHLCDTNSTNTDIMDLSDALDFPQQNNQQAGSAVWPGQPANPTWPGQPVNPTWPGQPVNPTWPGQPANPTCPGQPANPTWPGQPANPTWPGQPANPTLPGQPANPTWPGQPVNPTWPGQPVNPTWPGQPANPTWPGQPNQPAWPGQPGQPTAPGWPGPAPQTGPYGAPGEAPRALTVPFDLPLQSGVYNKMLITIVGEVKPNANNITINLKRGNDIAFHLNPRFNEGGRQAIVRNSLIGNQWGREEREVPSFPFVPGKPFELKILCTDTEFKVAVNKSHLLEYKHRIRELNQIRDLSIYSDVSLSSVNVETLQ